MNQVDNRNGLYGRSFLPASDGSVLMLGICALMIVTWSRGSLNTKVRHRDKGTRCKRDRRAEAYTSRWQWPLSLLKLGRFQGMLLRDTFVRISFHPGTLFGRYFEHTNRINDGRINVRILLSKRRFEVDKISCLLHVRNNISKNW